MAQQQDPQLVERVAQVLDPDAFGRRPMGAAQAAARVSARQVLQLLAGEGRLKEPGPLSVGDAVAVMVTAERAAWTPPQ